MLEIWRLNMYVVELVHFSRNLQRCLALDQL